LFKLGVLLVDYIKTPFAANNFAVCAALLYGGSYFHDSSGLFGCWLLFGLFVSEGYPSFGEVIR
jgi:hypothetical protein